MKKRTAVAVVGCGYWGPNLVRNFRSLPDCCLKTICDLDENRLNHVRSLYPGVIAETSYDQLIADSKVDAVAIATGVQHHFRMAKAALLAGKHVLIEKPMANSVDECAELIALAAKQELVLMVSHTFIYSAAVRKIKEIVENGDIGDLRYISSRRLNLGLFQTDINVAWDLAPHDISIILHIMEELPQSVNCRGAAHISKGIEDVTAMSLHFRRERSAIVHNSWHDPRKIREMTIVGSTRMIVYDDIAVREKIKIYDARVEQPPHFDRFTEFNYAYHNGDVYVPYVQPDEPLKTECEHFIDCIRQGLQPLTPGSAGLEVVRILEAASASLQADGASIDVSSTVPAWPGHHAAPRATVTPQPDPGRAATAGRQRAVGAACG